MRLVKLTLRFRVAAIRDARRVATSIMGPPFKVERSSQIERLTPNVLSTSGLEVHCDLRAQRPSSASVRDQPKCPISISDCCSPAIGVTNRLALGTITRYSWGKPPCSHVSPRDTVQINPYEILNEYRDFRPRKKRRRTNRPLPRENPCPTLCVVVLKSTGNLFGEDQIVIHWETRNDTPRGRVFPSSAASHCRAVAPFLPSERRSDGNSNAPCAADRG